tara:strand:+ start:355 stop:531 length:177 start_codon:yes stop_codon:yes gene_type:complete
MRELKSLITLIVSILTFVILLPFVILVATIKVLTSILKIAENTTTYFMESVQKEIIQN